MDLKLLWKHLKIAWVNYKKELVWLQNNLKDYTFQIHADKVRKDIKKIENDFIEVTQKIIDNIKEGTAFGSIYEALLESQKKIESTMVDMRNKALKEGIFKEIEDKAIRKIKQDLENIKKAAIDEHKKLTSNLFQ